MPGSHPNPGRPAGPVLVTGASGTIGRRLVPALVAAGHQVRAMTRSDAAAQTAAAAGAEPVRGGVTDPGREACVRVFTTDAADPGGDGMQIGVQIPDFTFPSGPDHLGADLAAIARAAEDAGFGFLSVSDHFLQIGMLSPPERGMLEAYTTLGYLAACTTQVKLLSLVTGAVYRHPGILAKTVTTLDVLSGGRAWFGIGIGPWNDEEARGLGVRFPPVAERFERLEETLQICLQMWRGDESPYTGRHYQLERPINSPQALSSPHPPIMIGGGGERKTLRLVARYADACNLLTGHGQDLARKLDVLRAHCDAEGRDYDEITKTCYFVFDVGDKGEKAAQVVDQLGELASLGFQAAIGPVVNVWQITPLEIIGSEVIPAVTGL
jgi:F420-dependent oxidoreductase-like protein